MVLEATSVETPNISTESRPVESINAENHSAASCSTITDDSPSRRQAQIETNHARINMGQHPTPPQQEFEVREQEYEEGCDSDGDVGPFYDAVHGEELYGYHEEVHEGNLFRAEVENAQIENAGNTGNQAPRTRFEMADEAIMSLKKGDLVEQCRKLGLDTRGNKGPLQERLKKAREERREYLTEEEAANPYRLQLASDGFSPLSKWEMIEDRDNTIDLTDELEVDGVKYRAPTTPREEFERTGCGRGGVGKYNLSLNVNREKFQKKARVPKTDRAGRIMKDRVTREYIYEETEIKTSVPNMEFIKKHGLDYNSLPYEWFDTFIPRKKSAQQQDRDGKFTIGDWVRYTNLRAVLANAGKCFEL